MNKDEIEKNITIIINSCDKYSDLWYPFFSIFYKNWPDCKYPIILNTESKKIDLSEIPLNIKCLQLFSENSGIDWSSRLISTLRTVKTKYVLCMLDDEFLMQPVSQSKMDRLLSIMQFDKRISAIILDTPFTDDIFPLLTKSNIHKGLYPLPFARYNYNSANAALWRKSRLLHYLNQGESPWEFEINTKHRLLYYDKFYYCDREYSPIITSFLEIFGVGIVKGKWLWKNPELFSKFNISIDYNKRGIKTISTEQIDLVKNKMLNHYRSLSQRSKKMVFKDFIDRYRDIAPKWIHRIKAIFRFDR